MSDDENFRWFNLPSLGLSVRVLFTGYLAVTGVGLLMAFLQILATHGRADGKFGLSLDDVVYSYYGNRGNSRLEVKLNGTMKDKAPTWVRSDMIKWVRNDAPRAEWDNKIRAQFHQYCIRCHGAIPSLADFTTYEKVKPKTTFDKGMTIDSLTQVSHIHLFGIAFIFFFAGLIFSFTVGVPRWLKVVVIAMPFIFILMDITSWWLTKLHPAFAILTILGGFGYVCTSGFMWVSSLYQMWVMPYKGKNYDQNPWRE